MHSVTCFLITKTGSATEMLEYKAPSLTAYIKLGVWAIRMQEQSCFLCQTQVAWELCTWTWTKRQHETHFTVIESLGSLRAVLRGWDPFMNGF